MNSDRVGELFPPPQGREIEMREGTDYHVCCHCYDAERIREGLLQAVTIGENHLGKYHGGLHCLEHVIEEIKVAATAEQANEVIASSSPSYTLKEIEALAWVFVDGNDASGDQDAPDAIKLRMFMGAFVAWLAKREREGLG